MINRIQTVPVSRRKIVKYTLSSMFTIASYHILPTKWSVPIIESVFLPAHAATSSNYIQKIVSVTRSDDDLNIILWRDDNFLPDATYDLIIEYGAGLAFNESYLNESMLDDSWGINMSVPMSNNELNPGDPVRVTIRPSSPYIAVDSPMLIIW